MKQFFGGCGLALVLASGPVQAQEFELTRDLAQGTRFVLRNVVGDVHLEAGTGRTLEVRAKKTAGRRGNPDEVDITTIEIDGGVAVCVYYPMSDRRRSRGRDHDDDRDRSRRDDPCRRDSEWQGTDRNDTSVDFVVRLPAGLRVDARTVSGDLIGRGLRGTLDLGTVSGDVRLTDTEGDILEASSVSGDVELEGIRVREVTAETVSGDVTFAGPVDGKGRYDLKSLSGDVVMTVPERPDATVNAVTFSGDIDSVFPVTTTGRSRRHRFSATWGSGTAKLDLESFSGDIKIREAR